MKRKLIHLRIMNRDSLIRYLHLRRESVSLKQKLLNLKAKST